MTNLRDDQIVDNMPISGLSYYSAALLRYVEIELHSTGQR